MAYAKIIDIDDPGYFRLKSIDQSQLKQFLKNPADWHITVSTTTTSPPTHEVRYGVPRLPARHQRRCQPA